MKVHNLADFLVQTNGYINCILETDKDTYTSYILYLHIRVNK